MAELVAVKFDTCTPISLPVLVDGREVDLSSVASGSITINGTTISLAADTTANRMTGLVPAALTSTPGAKTGTGALVTNTGTYTFPTQGLTLIVLDW